MAEVREQAKQNKLNEEENEVDDEEEEEEEAALIKVVIPHKPREEERVFRQRQPAVLSVMIDGDGFPL